MGLIYQQKREFEKAEEAFLEALSLQEDEKFFLIQLGTIYINQDRIDEAVKTFEKVIEVGGDPEDEDVLFAKTTLESIQKKLSVTINHTFLTYDSNRTNDEFFKEPAISTSFGVNLRYAPIRNRQMTLPINFSMQNTFGLSSSDFDQFSQTYFNSETLGSHLNYNLTDEYSIRTGYNFRFLMNRNGPTAHTHTLTLEGTRREKWPSAASLHYDYFRNVSFRSSLFDSDRHTIRLSLNQNLEPIGGTLSFSYSFSILNAVLILQENSAHTGNLGYSRPILPGLSGNINYTFQFRDFKIPDPFGTPRETINNSIVAGLSFFVRDGFTISANYSFQIANTTGLQIIVDPNLVLEDQVVPLADFKKHVISIGGSLTF